MSMKSYCFWDNVVFRIGLLSLFLSISVAHPVAAQQPTTRIHVVKENETIYTLARRYQVAEELLYKLNPGSEYGILIGQELVIPTQEVTATSYIVQPGDTLYSIAKRYHTTVDKLVALNPKVTQKLSIGDSLWIPQNREGEPLTEGTAYYKVQTGDTLYSIARQHQISIENLLALNPSISQEGLSVGYILRLNATGEVAPQQNGLFVPQVSLLLPIGSTASELYIRFYQGFLLGLLQLKNEGYSVNVDVHNTHNSSDIQQLAAEGAFSKSNLIIGGNNAESVALLSSMASDQCLYISPFESQVSLDNLSSSVFLIDSKSQEIDVELEQAFLQYTEGKKVLFVENDQGNKRSLVAQLKTWLKQKGRPYAEADFFEVRSGYWPITPEVPTVVILNDDHAEPVLQLINSLKQNVSSYANVSFFGYPKWMEYKLSFLKEVGSLGSVIYNNFFFDSHQAESQIFLQQYQQFYQDSPLQVGLSYAVLGYDVARYFIKRWAVYGARFKQPMLKDPTDGLQHDLRFRQVNGKKSYTCTSFFLIRYDAEGRASRYALY